MKGRGFYKVNRKAVPPHVSEVELRYIGEEHIDTYYIATQAVVVVLKW